MSGLITFLLSKSGQRVMALLIVLSVLLGAVVRCDAWKRNSERSQLEMIYICEASQYDFRAVEAKHYAATCKSEVARLARVEIELQDQSQKVALQLIEAREAKAQTDAALAAALARRTAQAVAQMEAVEDGIEENQVSGDWACAVNQLGGLRAYGC